MSNLFNIPQDLSPTYFTQTVTPKIASEILSRNDNNRRVSLANVKFLSRQMKNGEWALNGETIKIAKDGTLIDGQHRLLAIVDSNTSQEMSFVTSLDKSAFATIDSGRSRTVSDVLGVAGNKNTSILGSLIRIKLQFDTHGNLSSKGAKMTSTQIIEIANDDKRLTISSSWANTASKKTKLLSPAALAVTHYYLEALNPAKFDSFMDKVFDGYGEKGDPALVLRKLLLDAKLKKGEFRSEDILKYVIRAFEYHLAGRSVKSIVLRRDEKLTFELIERFRMNTLRLLG